MTHQLVVCGASGFIGRHLLRALRGDPKAEVRVLVHRRCPTEAAERSNVVGVPGDLMQPDSLRSLTTSGCTVINLAYMRARSRDENLAAVNYLAEACLKAKVARLVHVSTATVAGAVAEDVVTESTAPRPSTDYERTKLEIEQLLVVRAQGQLELVIVRPTAVFGFGGENLVTLAARLLKGNKLESYIRSCLHGRRRMNLVCVDNVISAIRFAAEANSAIAGETFIVSDDEDDLNNYRDVEALLMTKFHLHDYPFPPLAVPRSLLGVLLKVAGRSNANPNRVYSSAKIANAGFKKVVSFSAGVNSFADWYYHAHAPRQ